jgi:hypothetical protein
MLWQNYQQKQKLSTQTKIINKNKNYEQKPKLSTKKNYQQKQKL